MLLFSTNPPFISQAGWHIFAFVPLFAFLVTGCKLSDNTTTSGQALVVDLPAVARALGRDVTMQNQLDDAYHRLNVQLAEIGSNLEKKLENNKAALNDKNEDQKSEFDTLVVQTNLQLEQTKLMAEKKGALFRAQLLSQFRREVLDVAKQIALHRGAPAVRLASSDLLWYSSAIDITDETIGMLRARRADYTETPDHSQNSSDKQPQAEPGNSTTVGNEAKP